MSKMIVDRLYQSVAEKGPICVGLDTDISYVPQWLRDECENDGEAVLAFNKQIIDACCDVAGCFKVQIAYYESLGLQGLQAYRDTLAYLRQKGQIVIADIKRGDIAKTAEMYAKGHFTGDFEADLVTLSPFMGLDSITPYLPYIKEQEKGVFVLVRTSNPGREDFQYIRSESGETIYDIVGRRLQDEIGVDCMGQCGYSSVGAVIGGTSSLEAETIRKKLDKTFFLIPGYGAQGGKAEDIARYLKGRNGGVVNSSRAVLLAYNQAGDERDFATAARNEVIKAREEILSACAEYEK